MDLGSRYEYIRELGSGGAARILLVRDLYLRKEVALKLLHDPPMTREDLEQVQREFALLAEIDHPGIARAHDFGYLGDRPYFTSEYVEGEPLSRHGGPWGAEDLSGLVADLAEALAFLHSHGILHLDIKPANIIVSSQPGRRRPVLIDFGLWRSGASLRPGAILRGSLPYMAPEYSRGDRLGPWTDIYALGVTLYRVATQTFPRPLARAGAPGSDAEAWEAVPRPPSEVCPALGPDLDRIVLKCLALDPAARFRSGGDLLATVRHIQGGRTVAAGGEGALGVTVGREADLGQVERFLAGISAEARLRTGSGHPSAAAEERLSGEPGGAPDLRPAPASMLVTGPPGMGQSHLLRAAKIRAQTRGFRSYLEVGYAGRPTSPGSLLRAIGAHVPDVVDRERWEAFLAQLRRPRRPSRSEITEGERRLRRAGEVARAAACVREPVLLLVDGLQFWDEVSIELLTDLVRSIGEKGPESRPPLAVLAGYREEGPSARLLAELTDYLRQPSRGAILTLRALGPAESASLYRSRGGSEPDLERGFALFQRTGGVPRRIVDLVAREGGCVEAMGAGSPTPAGEPRTGAARRSVPSATGRLVVRILGILDRPATEGEVARLAGLATRVARGTLVALERAGLVARTEGETVGGEWTIATAGRRIVEGAPRRDIRALHRTIAAKLEGGSADDGGPVEAVRHYLRAGCRGDVARLGLVAAERLQSRFQHRAALEMYRAVLDSLPARFRGRRVDVALRIADLHARLGDVGVDEGIRILREMLPMSSALPPPMRERVLLRLATLHARGGDFRRAEALFVEGLEGAAGSRRGERRGRACGLGREELLLFTNEHAALKAVVGDYDAALELCEHGLRLAGRARNPEIREVVLNLHATRANLALRRFRSDEAIRDLERAVQIAEAIGSPGNQATVLNNLGVVYSQCDRYDDAVRVYREAERLCLRLDEGPSLASIHGNLAVLHSKLGEFVAAEQELSSGERLLPGVIGRRQEFFLRHARGLCLLYRGRYAEARASLEAAIRLGEATGDRHVLAFDELYRAEALLFEGRPAEAERELDRLSEMGTERVRRMALARMAFLSATLGRREEAEAIASRYAGLPVTQAVPFLDAWDALYTAWGLALVGDEARALESLSPSESFFRDKRLRPALDLTVCVRAEAALVAGRPEAAEAILEAVTSRDGRRGTTEAPRSDLTAILRPLILCRLLMGRTDAPVDRPRCADLLAQAGAALISNPIPEWSERLEALRTLLTGSPRATLARVERGRRDRLGKLPETERTAALGSPAWKAWVRGLAGSWKGSRGKSLGTRTSPAAEGSTTRFATGQLLRARLVARSPAMGRLLESLDRLRGSELPVLVRGETGSGKELVARIIHQESRRAAGPFRVVDCATIPPALLESELFGARAGAYTGIDEDRPGILALASGGSVLVDEIAGSAPEMQAKLLRVLSSGTARPVGAEAETAVDVRFVFSTARDLEREVAGGRFRPDLYHRIRVLVLDVPPLRDRPEDLEELVAALLAEAGDPSPRLAPGAIERLRRSDWPGNVRELRNVLARAHIHGGDAITAEAVDLSLAEPETSTFFPRNLLAGDSLRDLKRRLERDYIAYHFRRLKGDARALARFLGHTRRQLYRRCARLGVRLRSLGRDG